MSSGEYAVYFHRNVHNGEVFYVGIGKGRRPYHTIQRSRFWKHYVEKNNGFNVEIAHAGLQHNEAVVHEIAYIARFGKRIDGTGTLVNMTDGGEGCPGRKMTDENKAKLAAIHRNKFVSDEVRKKMSLGRTGCKVTVRTEEHKRKLADAQKHSVSVVQIDSDGFVCGIFKSFHDAARAIGDRPPNIRRATEKFGRKVRGFRYKLKREVNGLFFTTIAGIG